MINLILGSSLVLTMFAAAIRPEGKMYHAQQLEIDAIEKVLGKKFSIPFPEKRFDIDYWDKGDLVVIAEGNETVLVTCPFVAGSQIHLAMGSGTDSKSFKMTSDLFVSFSKTGELNGFSVFPMGGSDWPTHEDRVRRKEDESAYEYFDRAKKHWLKWYGEKKGAVTTNQLKAAFRVLDAALKQRPKSKAEAPVKDPTIEDVFQKK